MIILGLDPGIARTGYGVLDTTLPNLYVTAGCFETPPHHPTGRRLQTIADELNDIITEYQPDQAVIEQVYFGANRTTATVTSHVHGILLYILQLHAIPATTATPLEIKHQLTGYGYASKKQVQQAVTHTLKLPAVPEPDDAADALAAALTNTAHRSDD